MDNSVRKESTSDSEQKITQQMLDQELQVHQERLLQLLDQGDNDMLVESEVPMFPADLPGKKINETSKECRITCFFFF